jgi:predicted nucleotidyltransferase component of viral defense system
MLTRHAITQRADADGVDALVAERDYVLAHIISQLHRAVPSDGGHLVFKGGTALRFVHMRNYRYSADLDFSVVNGAPEPGIASLEEVLAAAKEHAGFPQLELVGDKKPLISFVGPLGASRPRQIKLDVSADELVESVDQGTVQAIWPDLPVPVAFSVYPIDEISAEKLRCIIQRVQCRDLYDLWRMTEEKGVVLDEVLPLFERKARSKGLDPASFRDRFEDRIDRYKRRWSIEMSEHVADPPRFDDVVRAVRRQLRSSALLTAGAQRLT